MKNNKTHLEKIAAHIRTIEKCLYKIKVHSHALENQYGIRVVNSEVLCGDLRIHLSRGIELVEKALGKTAIRQTEGNHEKLIKENQTLIFQLPYNYREIYLEASTDALVKIGGTEK